MRRLFGDARPTRNFDWESTSIFIGLEVLRSSDEHDTAHPQLLHAFGHFDTSGVVWTPPTYMWHYTCTHESPGPVPDPPFSPHRAPGDAGTYPPTAVAPGSITECVATCTPGSTFGRKHFDILWTEGLSIAADPRSKATVAETITYSPTSKRIGEAAWKLADAHILGPLTTVYKVAAKREREEEDEFPLD
jgi:hypothetical protein